MQSSASFSTSRQGRPRPSNISPGGRSGSDERPWPSPSFNSSMSFTNVDDIFVDTARTSSSLRRSFSGLPPMPITASILASSRPQGDKLPGLSDLFVNDQGILAPLTPLSTPHIGYNDLSLSNMASSSASMFRSFSNLIDARRSSLLATQSPHSTPTRSAMPSQEGVVGLGIDMESTPKASRYATASEASLLSATTSYTSPPRVCPLAPKIGTLPNGMFNDAVPAGGSSLGKRPCLGLNWSRFQVPDDAADEDPISPGYVPMEREAMVQLESGFPRMEGLNDLVIDLNPASRQAKPTALGFSQQQLNTAALSPSGPSQRSKVLKYSGVTPLMRMARLSSSSTPTKSTNVTTKARGEKRVASPKSPSSKVKTNKSPGQLTFRAQYQAQTKEQRANASREISQTPIKSKPMYRLDNGSSAKQPKGHSTKPTESLWGVFGVKDEWRPLAPPNVSKSGGHIKKSYGDSIPRHLADVHDKENASPMRGTYSSPGKRGSMDVDLSSSPTKHRSALGNVGNSTLKENLMSPRGRHGETSPHKRQKAPLSGLSSPPKNQAIGLR